MGKEVPHTCSLSASGNVWLQGFNSRNCTDHCCTERPLADELRCCCWILDASTQPKGRQSEPNPNHLCPLILAPVGSFVAPTTVYRQCLHCSCCCHYLLLSTSLPTVFTTEASSAALSSCLSHLGACMYSCAHFMYATHQALVFLLACS